MDEVGRAAGKRLISVDELDLRTELDRLLKDPPRPKTIWPEKMYRLWGLVHQAVERESGPEADRIRTAVSERNGLRADLQTWGEDAQAHGALREVASPRIVAGVWLDQFAAHAHDEYLSVAAPSLTNPRRYGAAWTLYWADLMLFDRGRLREHLICEAVGLAAASECVARLAKHPTSRDVYVLFQRNDKDALARLLEGAMRATQHEGKSREELDPDERESMLQELLTAGFRQRVPAKLPAFQRTSLMMLMAMEGKFDHVTHEVRQRFISQLRARFGLTKGGKAQHRSIEPDLWQPGRHVTDWKREFIGDLTVPQIIADSALDEIFGPAAALVRFRIAHPGEKLTQSALAERLGRTDRTIRSYQKAIATPEKAEAFILRFIDPPKPPRTGES